MFTLKIDTDSFSAQALLLSEDGLRLPNPLPLAEGFSGELRIAFSGAHAELEEGDTFELVGRKVGDTKEVFHAAGTRVEGQNAFDVALALDSADIAALFPDGAESARLRADAIVTRANGETVPWQFFILLFRSALGVWDPSQIQSARDYADIAAAYAASAKESADKAASASLTFDTLPTPNSENLVKSGGIFTFGKSLFAETQTFSAKQKFSAPLEFVNSEGTARFNISLIDNDDGGSVQMQGSASVSFNSLAFSAWGKNFLTLYAGHGFENTFTMDSHGSVFGLPVSVPDATAPEHAVNKRVLDAQISSISSQIGTTSGVPEFAEIIDPLFIQTSTSADPAFSGNANITAHLGKLWRILSLPEDDSTEIFPSEITIFRRSGNQNAPQTPRWLRIYRRNAAGDAWVEAWQSSNSIVPANIASAAGTPMTFKMENRDGRGGIPANEIVAIVFPTSENADFASSFATLMSVSATSAYPGALSGSALTPSSPTQNWSAAFRIRFSTPATRKTLSELFER